MSNLKVQGYLRKNLRTFLKSTSWSVGKTTLDFKKIGSFLSIFSWGLNLWFSAYISNVFTKKLLLKGKWGLKISGIFFQIHNHQVIMYLWRNFEVSSVGIYKNSKFCLFFRKKIQFWGKKSCRENFKKILIGFIES